MTSVFFVAAITFDIKTAIITAFTTVIAMPVVLLLFKTVARHLKQWTEAAVEGIFYWGGRYVMHGLAARISLRAYCRILLASTKFVPVPSTRDINLPIDEIFVPLNLENASISQRVVTHATILAYGGRLRLVGDPGSGKSCLAKRLMRDAAQAALKNPATARLPVLFELRNIAVPPLAPDALGEWFYSTLRKQIEAVNVPRMSECVDAYANASGLLILLDGLDEISSAEYPRAEAAIQALSRHLDAKGRKNVVVLSSRTQFHQQVRESYVATYPNVFYLKPFTPTDIYEFLTRWPFQHQARSQVNRIFKDLTDRPTLRELCGNPLILSMYVSEAEATTAQIVPDSRTEFYSRVCDELLVNRRVRQTGRQVGRSATRDLREKILGSWALDHLLDTAQPGNSLSWKRAIKTIMKKLNVDEAAAAVFFDELARETGLFSTERSQETFRFIHLTLCEFFAATEAVKNRKDGWRTVIEAQHAFITTGTASHRQRLLEVIPFACGLLHPINREDAITDVAALQDWRLLARCLLETKQYAHPVWNTFVTQQRISLIGAPIRDEDWLFDFHLFNVVVRDAVATAEHGGIKLDAPNLDDFLNEIVACHEGGLTSIIDAYAEKDAAAVFRIAEIAGIDLVHEFPDVVVQSFDQKPFMELLLERAPNVKAPADVSLWAAVVCEAGLRSRVVAKEIHARPSIESWRAGRQSTWVVPMVIDDSLYAQSLAIATEAGKTGRFKLVDALVAVPAPWRYRYLLSRTVQLIAMAIVLVAVVSLYRLERGVTPATGVVYLLALLMYPIVFASLFLRRIYRHIVGLTSSGPSTNTTVRYGSALRVLRLFVPRSVRVAAADFIAIKEVVAPGDLDAQFIRRLL